MKKAIITSIIFALFIGCKNANILTGSYYNGNSIEFKFKNRPDEFEYFLRGEMGTLQYSTGTWRLEKNMLYLSGFGDGNINILDVKSVVNNSSLSSNSTQIEVHYNTDKVVTYIESIIFINDDKSCRIEKDTVLIPNYKVETIQVKSYISYTGLLSSPPKIDTLYSSKIRINDGGSKNKNIVLNFTVHPYDFARVKFNDTLTVKSNRILYLNKIKLKK